MTGAAVLLAVLASLAPASWVPLPQPVPRTELRVLEGLLDATLDANRSLRCPRPVLFGAPRAGPGAGDIALVVEGGAGLSDCYGFLREFGEVLFRAPDGGGEQQTGLVNRFTEVCRTLPEAVRRAVSHEDACSPYVPGCRGVPARQTFLVAVAGMRNLAGLTVLAGRPGDAAQRFLEVLRFAQDLERGGVPLVLSTLSTSVFNEVLLNDLVQLVTRPELRAEELQRIAAALEQLVATEPSFPRVIAADTTWLAMEAGLPMLRGPGWAPPGGFSNGRTLSPRDYAPDLLPWVPVAWEKGLIFAAFMDLDERRRRACPLRAGPGDCYRGLLAMGTARAAAESTPVWVRWVRILVARDPWIALRAFLVDRIEAMVDVPLAQVAVDHASRSFHLAAVRFLVEVQGERQRTGRCPTREEFSGARWARALRDPVFGGVLDARWSGSGTLVVETRGRFGTQRLRAQLPLPECEGE